MLLTFPIFFAYVALSQPHVQPKAFVTAWTASFEKCSRASGSDHANITLAFTGRLTNRGSRTVIVPRRTTASVVQATGKPFGPPPWLIESETSAHGFINLLRPQPILGDVPDPLLFSLVAPGASETIRVTVGMLITRQGDPTVWSEDAPKRIGAVVGYAWGGEEVRSPTIAETTHRWRAKGDLLLGGAWSDWVIADLPPLSTCTAE